LLVLGAALVDALGQVERALQRFIKGRVARGHAAHAVGRLAMATGTRLGARLAGMLPQGLALLDPQQAGVERVVALHGLGGRAHEVEAGAPGVGLGLGCRAEQA
jgi:hypothetical protein